MIYYADDYQDRIDQAIRLATSLGASAAKISLSHTEANGVGFENARLKQTSNSETLSYNIMVIVDGHRGAASGNQPEYLEELVRRAVTLAKVGAQSHFTTFPKPADRYRDIQTFDPAVLDYSQDRMIADCQNLIDYLRTLDPALVVGAGASKGVSESISMNSAGLVDKDRATAWHISADFEKTTGTDLLACGAGRSWGQLNDLYDLDYIKRKLATDLQRASREASIPDGKWPLILPPSFVLQFLAPAFMGISGRSVFRGTSPLRDKLGTQPFSEALSIEDNPFIDFCSDSANMDGAGLPTQRRMLVENGRLNLFLYDYDTAFMAGKEPTANDDCAPYNPLVRPGTVHSKELFRSVRRGLYIKRLLGFGQSNFANGDFSANVELGFAVEDGEITGRLKNVMIAGNVFEMLAQPLVVSSNISPSLLQPYLLLPEVTVVSK